MGRLALPRKMQRLGRAEVAAERCARTDQSFTYLPPHHSTREQRNRSRVLQPAATYSSSNTLGHVRDENHSVAFFRTA